MNTGMGKVILIGFAFIIILCLSTYNFISGFTKSNTVTARNATLIQYTDCRKTPNAPDCIVQNMNCYDSKNYKKHLASLNEKEKIQLAMKATLEDGDRLVLYAAPQGKKFYAFVIGADNNQEEEICLVAEGTDFTLARPLL